MRGQVIDLYKELLFRTPNDLEISHWLNTSLSPAEIRQGILLSPERASKVVKLDGHDVVVNPLDHTAQRIRGQEGFGDWDLLIQYLGPGQVSIDVGAHQGCFTVKAAARGSTVIAVEAGLENVLCLQRTSQLNPSLDIRIFHCCSWSHKTALSFYEDRAWGHVVTPEIHDGHEATATVSAEPVDDLVGELIGRAACAKIDVEGSELETLRGMKRLLWQGIDILYENNSHCLAHRNIELDAPARFLEQFGYKNYLVYEDALYPLTGKWTQPTTVLDILATKKSPELFGREVRKPMTSRQMSNEMLKLVHLAEGKNHVRREIRKHPELATEKLLRTV